MAQLDGGDLYLRLHSLPQPAVSPINIEDDPPPQELPPPPPPVTAAQPTFPKPKGWRKHVDSTPSLAVYVGQSREENAGLGLFVDTLVTSVGHHEAVVILKYLGLVVKWGARPPPISGANVLMGPQYYIDASSNDCAARYICEAFEREPNCWINVRAGEGIVTLAENITLQRGSELLTRYGWEYWALQLGALSNATFARCVSFYELYRPERLDLVPKEFHERVLALRPDIEEIHTRVAPPTQPILVRGLPDFLRPADANPVIPKNLPRNSLSRSKTEPKKPDTASRSISSFFQPVRNSAASDAATPPFRTHLWRLRTLALPPFPAREQTVLLPQSDQRLQTEQKKPCRWRAPQARPPHLLDRKSVV